MEEEHISCPFCGFQTDGEYQIMVSFYRATAFIMHTIPYLIYHPVTC